MSLGLQDSGTVLTVRERHENALNKLPGMDDYQYLLALLHLGSALELALMVQYLYAAYSLGGDEVPEEHRHMVHTWRDAIVTVAREEMGHLLTVQNMITFVGGKVNLSPHKVRWHIAWFELEPLSLDSLACYVATEMPEAVAKVKAETDAGEIAEINERAEKHVGGHGDRGPAVEHVGHVYAKIIDLLRNEEAIPESKLRPETYAYQASWDEWGRGYRPDPKHLDDEGNWEKDKVDLDEAARLRAHVMVDRAATRTQAINALMALSVQGEGAHAPTKQDEVCHFHRFLNIYREWKRTVKDDSWKPTLAVPTNPVTHQDENPRRKVTYVSAKVSRDWAHLFNHRFKLLLGYLSHIFELPVQQTPGEPNVRAMLMHRAFGEMYNIKTISGILVRLPLSDSGSDAKAKAGPPFETPELEPKNGWWQEHLETLTKADGVCIHLLKEETKTVEAAYLKALLNLDAQTREWVIRIEAGKNPAGARK